MKQVLIALALVCVGLPAWAATLNVSLTVTDGISFVSGYPDETKSLAPYAGNATMTFRVATGKVISVVADLGYAHLHMAPEITQEYLPLWTLAVDPTTGLLTGAAFFWPYGSEWLDGDLLTFTPTGFTYRGYDAGPNKGVHFKGTYVSAVAIPVPTSLPLLGAAVIPLFVRRYSHGAPVTSTVRASKSM